MLSAVEQHGRLARLKFQKRVASIISVLTSREVVKAAIVPHMQECTRQQPHCLLAAEVTENRTDDAPLSASAKARVVAHKSVRLSVRIW